MLSLAYFGCFPHEDDDDDNTHITAQLLLLDHLLLLVNRPTTDRPTDRPTDDRRCSEGRSNFTRRRRRRSVRTTPNDAQSSPKCLFSPSLNLRPFIYYLSTSTYAKPCWAALHTHSLTKLLTRMMIPGFGRFFFSRLSAAPARSQHSFSFISIQ